MTSMTTLFNINTKVSCQDPREDADMDLKLYLFSA